MTRNILPRLNPLVIATSVVFLSLSARVSVGAEKLRPGGDQPPLASLASGGPPLRVHFINVGYGDAVLIEFPDSSNMLIDAGGGDFAPQLMTYLQKRDVRRLDAVMITHPHENHFGGLKALTREMPIGRFFHNGDPQTEEGYAVLLEHLKEKRIPIDVLRAGRQVGLSSGAVVMEILHPRDLTGSANDNSMVAWLKYQKTSILFWADMESAQQEALIHEFEEIQEADCIKVPHHGGPLSEAFGRAFTDKIFIISTGPNPWGRPYAEDLQKLRGKVYRTDREGTIVVESDGAAVKVVP